MSNIDLKKPVLKTYEICELVGMSTSSVSRMRKRIEEKYKVTLNTSVIPTYLVLLDIGYTPDKVSKLTGVQV